MHTVHRIGNDVTFKVLYKLLFNINRNVLCRKQLHVSAHLPTENRINQEEKIKLTPDPPENPKTDWIGPPDSKSNIRPYQFYIPHNESKWQREFRLRREDNRLWNHQFWLEHNTSFFKEKEEFIKKRFAEKVANGEEIGPSLSPEEISEFYKRFLDNKYTVHMQYNKDWYRRNISLLWPALKVAVEKLWTNQR